MLLGAILALFGSSIAASAQYPPPQPPQQPPPNYPQGQQPYPAPAPGQQPYPAQPGYANPAPPPPMAPQQLDALVGRIALYPDPLLAQTLTASTFWADIPAAAGWADQHSAMTGDALTQAVQEDQLPWDPSILGLLPFPSVLDTMARDPDWTQQLGAAVLTQRPDVMDAVQRDRAQAYNYGYLRPNQYDNVVYADGSYQILPVGAGFYYVPVYNPGVVFVRPRPGFFVGGAISFGPRVVIGAGFVSAGFWAGPSIAWASHGIYVGGAPWGRTWANRGGYNHPYPHPVVRPAGPQVERHPVQPRGHEERRPPL